MMIASLSMIHGPPRKEKRSRIDSQILRPMPTPCPVEVERGADQPQVGERLWEVPQRLAVWTRLLRIQPQVVGVAEHLLEQQPCLLQPPPVGPPGAGQRLDQPEAA